MVTQNQFTFYELQSRSKALSFEQRKIIIEAIREVDLHKYLKSLFKAMEPSYDIQITHGPNEFGKDLVIVKEDNFSTDVIGVAVKRGDIFAKTSGDVEPLVDAISLMLNSAGREVVSQVKQAVRHRAVIKTKFETLKVTTVFVVIAGNVSRNARERIVREVTEPVEIFDITWLVNNFTEFYPNIFFVGNDVDFAIKKIQEIETKFQFQRKDGYTNFSDYFTEPFVTKAGSQLSSEDSSSETTSKLKSVFEDKKLPFSQLSAIIRTSQRIALIGDPGVGKSGALAKLALDEYRNIVKRSISKENTEIINIPFLTSAKEILNHPDLETLILSYTQGEIDGEQFKFSVLLVDSLDEVSIDMRKIAIEQAEKYADELKCPLVITSRKIEALDGLNEAYEQYEILPFQFQQAISCLNKLFTGDEGKIQNLVSELKNLNVHFPLIPLSIKMLVKVIEDNQDIPSSITELYSLYFEAILGRYNLEKGIEVLFEYQAFMNFFGGLAYEKFFQNQLLEITTEDYEDYIEYYGSQYLPNWSIDQKEYFMKELKRAGILDLKHSISFKHRTYLDYFTAFHLRENFDEIQDTNQIIVNSHYSSLWYDTAFFYIGLRKKIPTSLLTKIIEHDPENKSLIFSIRKIMIGRLFQAGWHSLKQDKLDGIEVSAKMLPVLHKQISETILEIDPTAPKIMNDFFTMMIGDTAFKSRTLKDINKQTIIQLLEEDAIDNFLSIASLLHATQSYLLPNEKQELLAQCLTAITDSDNTSFTREEEVRYLLVLSNIESNDRALNIAVKNKLRRTIRKAPDIAKALIS